MDTFDRFATLVIIGFACILTLIFSRTYTNDKIQELKAELAKANSNHIANVNYMYEISTPTAVIKWSYVITNNDPNAK